MAPVLSSLSHVLRVACGVATLGLTAAAAMPVAAQKLDTVVVNNGDRVTGEIKRMERGRLEYSTDDMGTLSIKWDKVLRLISPFFFEVETAEGLKYFGTLTDPGRDSLIVVTLIRADTLAVLDVVEITPIRRTFWSRINGRIDLGFTVAQANRALTLSSTGQIGYRGELASLSLDGNTYVQRQDSADATTRNELALGIDYYFKERWWASGVGRLQQNDELGLELRTSLTAAANRNLVHTNRVDLWAGAGLTGNREQFTSTSTWTTNLEALIQLGFDWFKFDTPKLDVSSTLAAYPSITVKSRVRVEFDLRSDYELWKDFTVGLQIRNSFDSSPPEGNVKHDYTVSFTIGWKWNR